MFYKRPRFDAYPKDIMAIRSIPSLLLLGSIAALSACQGDKPPAQKAKGPLIQSAFRCADFSQTIYFEARQSTVTPQADRLISLAAAHTKACRVTGVSVVGLADAPGGPDANLLLSQKRADAVRAELHRKGFDQVEIQTTAQGDAGAQTASGQARPVRRRAVITFHLAPPAA